MIGSTDDFTMIKTVNGKPVNYFYCVTCDIKVDYSRWLCGMCTDTIGSDNIISTIDSMPDYLPDEQYEEWLKLKLIGFM